jgi:hypothetical protein
MVFMQPLLFPRDLLKFLHWLFFKPFTLGRYMREIEPSLGADTSLYTLWKSRKGHPEVRSLLALSFFHILVTPWLMSFLLTLLLETAGYKIGLFGMLVSMLTGVMGMLAAMVGSMLVGVVAGVMAGVAVSVGMSAGLVMVRSVMGSVGFGVPEGVVLGVVVGVLGGVMAGVRMSVRFGVLGGVVMGVGFGVVFGVFVGVLVGVAISVCFLVCYYRFFLYVLEAPWSWVLSRSPNSKNLRLSPVSWDELIWLPLPGLDTHLSSIARQDRQSGLEAINYVAGSFRQGWAARRAILSLLVDDIALARDIPAIADTSAALGWLPQDLRDELKDILLRLDEISRHARAAEESETPYNRQEQLRLGLQLIQDVRKGLGINSAPELGPRLITALGSWEHAFSRAYALAQEEKGIPNVYVAGSPLAAQSKVFKGRRDIFRALERELVSQADQRPAVLLFGARRMGKTSVLAQLPNAIGPQVIPVMVDLQSAALSDNAVSLFARVAESIRNSALINRYLNLPDISKKALESEPYRAMSDWMQLVDKSVGERWVLLCLDEYEYLEKMLLDRRIDERAFQLLRTLIQNHPRLTLLFSGAHTLEDLQPLWSNYLINVRIIRINPLAEADAEELITKPIQNFPLVYEEDALERLMSETGCHPYLIQSTCQDLVHRLNDDNRFTANLQDVERALDSALESGAAYFNDLWNGPDCNDLQRAIQLEVAKAGEGRLRRAQLETALHRSGHSTPEIQSELNHLIHREVLEQEEDGVKFRFALIRRWIRYQKLGLK